MKIKRIFILFLVFTFLTNPSVLKSQCTISSGCGYNINVNIRTMDVVPSTTNCSSGGYNYDIRFSYTITTSGINTCYNDVVGYQPIITCLGQNSGYYSINIPAPTVGAPSATTTITGTLVTATNQYNPANDCATATPSSLNCSSLQVTIYGPGLSSTTYACSLNTLPVSLANFTAVFENRSVILKWTTFTEKNNRSFFVERSADGYSWEEIAELPGAGTSTEVNRYQSEDRHFNSSLNYYRLRQVDYDGRFKYSEIVAVQTGSDTPVFHYFPNPFQSELIIETKNEQPEEIVIVNSLNTPVYKGYIRKRSQIDLSAQPAGVYFIKLKNGPGESHYKLIKTDLIP